MEMSKSEANILFRTKCKFRFSKRIQIILFCIALATASLFELTCSLE